MRLLLGIVLLVVLVGSFYADYRWKRWMAAQREARKDNPEDFSGGR